MTDQERAEITLEDAAQALKGNDYYKRIRQHIRQRLSLQLEILAEGTNQETAAARGAASMLIKLHREIFGEEVLTGS